MPTALNIASGPQGDQGPQGVPGLSAYEVAVANGFVGDEAAWLASLVGPEGPITDHNNLLNRTAADAHPISAITGLQTALDDKAPISHVGAGGTAHAEATTSVAGFLSAADKTKLDGVAANANNYVHPNHTGDVTSTGDGATVIANNAVTNTKLADMAVSTIKGRATAGTGDPEDLTAAQVRTILNVADGAEVNQNAFSNVAVSGQTTIAADGKTDTLTVAAGSNVSLTTNATTDTLTVSVPSFPYGSLTGVPSTFAPSAHTHVTADITDLSSYTGFDARYYTETEADTRFVNVTGDTMTGILTLTRSDDVQSTFLAINKKSLGGTNQYTANWNSNGGGTAFFLQFLDSLNAVHDNVFWYDFTNKRVGIRNITPNNSLTVGGNADITGSLIINGTIPIGSERLRVVGTSRMEGVVTSTVTTGTAPFTVTSTTVNTNLNADLLDDQHGSYYLAWANLTGVPATFTPSAHTLDSHSNVTITANTNGEILRWNGTAWVNNTLAEAGIAAASHTHTTSDITDLSSYTGLDVRYYTETEVNTLLAGKSDTGHTHVAANISDSSLTGRLILTGSAISGSANGKIMVWSDLLQGLEDSAFAPADFATASHTHAATDITSGTLAAARMPALTGDVTTTVGTVATTIAANVVSNTKLRDSVALSVIGRSANSTGDPADIAAATDGHVLRRSGTTLGFGQVVAAGIASNVVDNTKLSDMAVNTIKGRITAGTGDPEDLTAAQVRTILNVADGANNYVLPTASAGTLGGVRVGSGLSIDGSGILSAAGGGLSWATITASTTAADGNGYIINASAGAVTLTLPVSPTEGMQIGFVATNVANTITIARNSQLINGVAEDVSIESVGSGAVIVYSVSDGWWVSTEVNANSSYSGFVSGQVIAHASSVGPGAGWLECNGQNVSRSTYSGLFSAIGTVWGAGDGSTTFTLPDFRRRTLIGAGGTAVSGPANTVGSTGGAETHTLSIAEMPSHNHTYSAPYNTVAAAGGSQGVAYVGGTINTGSQGSGSAHNNMQPSAVVSYWIKA